MKIGDRKIGDSPQLLSKCHYKSYCVERATCEYYVSIIASLCGNLIKRRRFDRRKRDN